MYPTGWKVWNYSANDYYNNRTYYSEWTTPVMSFNAYFYLMKNGVTKLDHNVISEQVDDIKAAGKGESISIDMRKEDGYIATEMPTEFLMAAKGKDVDIVLNMGKYSWTINGKDITAEKPEDIDLEVLFDYDFIDDKVIDVFTDKEARQLYLAYSGKFGFTAKLKMNYGKEHHVKHGNLFYYNPDNGEMEFECAAVIDEEGYLNLDFTHASDYIIVLSDTQMENNTENDTDKVAEDNTENESDEKSNVEADQTTDKVTEKNTTDDKKENSVDLDTKGNDDKDKSNSDTLLFVIISILVVVAVVGAVVVFLYKTGRLNKIVDKLKSKKE